MWPRYKTETAQVLALFLVGGIGAATVTTWLVRSVEAGWSASSVALYFASVGVASLLVLTVVQVHLRRLLRPSSVVFVTQVAAGLGSIVTAQLTAPFGVIVVGFLLQGFYTLANVEILSARRSAGTASVIITRAGYAGGWVAGAPLGGLLAGAAGGDAALTGTGIAQVCAAVLLRAIVKSTSADDHVTASGPTADRKMSDARASTRRLKLFALSFALLSLGGPMRTSVLPVYMLSSLALPPATVGFILGLAPAVELPLFLLMGWLARHADRRRQILLIGGAASPIYFWVLAEGPPAELLAVLQALFAVYVVTATGLAVVVAQTFEGQPATTATSTMFVAESGGNLAGSALAVAGVSALGVPQAFLLPTAAGLLGLTLLAVIAKQGFPTVEPIKSPRPTKRRI